MTRIRANSELDRIRLKKGMLKKELAEKAKISPQSMGQIISKIITVSPKTAKLICEALEADFDKLFIITEN